MLAVAKCRQKRQRRFSIIAAAADGLPMLGDLFINICISSRQNCAVQSCPVLCIDLIIVVIIVMPLGMVDGILDFRVLAELIEKYSGRIG